MEAGMDDILIATIISEGGKILSEIIRSNQSSKRKPLEIQYPEIPDALPGFSESGGSGSPRLISSQVKVIDGPRPLPAPTKEVDYAPVQSLTGEKVATSCVGCAIGHLATVSGLLKECVRFVGEGMDSPNIIDRLNTCLDELNAMERVDLLPNKIAELPEWERQLAHRALEVSRDTRHFIEAGVNNSDEFEKMAAHLINERQAIGSAWLQQKLRALSKDDKEEIQRRVMAKIQSIGEEK
jgi:hypothetical protein